MARQFDRPLAGGFLKGASVRLPGAIGVLAAFSVASGPLAAQAARPAAQGGANSVDLVIAATTDTHGRLRGWDYYANKADPARGLARVGTIMDSLRAANPSRVVLVDAGDLLQGNSLTDAYQRSKSARPNPVVATMNALQYDAAAIGNHEFNYGVPFLDAAVKQARFPFLAANVRDASGKLKYAATTVFDRGGVRVGIVGATTPGSMVWDRDHLREAKLTVGDIIPAVKAGVADVRARGADVVIVVLHSGFGGPSSYDAAAAGLPEENVAGRIPSEVSGVDLVVFGHSHQEMIDSTVNGTLVIQPRQWATSVGVATISLRKNGAKWAVASKKAVSVPATGHAESPKILAASQFAHDAAVKYTTTPAGKTTVAWRGDSSRVQDTPIIDFVAELMRREAKADLAATAAFSLDSKLNPGDVTIAQLSQLYPYENLLRAVRINGAQLRAFLEHSSRYYRTLNADGSAPAGGIVDNSVPGYNFDVVSGADYVIDLRKPVGERITSLSVKGKPVSDTDVFTFATNNYRQSGGGGYAMLATLPLVYEKEVDIRGLLFAELQRVGTIKQEDYFTKNWRIEPASAVAMAYAQQNRNASQSSSGNASNSAAPQPTGARTLRLITVSDFHAALEGRKDERGRIRGGAMALEAALIDARNECKDRCTSITVDGGDLFAGSPASDWAAGKPTIAAYNRMGISTGALGNHELDFGQDTLRMRLAELNYRVLGINVLGADGKIPSWLKGDTIIVRDGLRIGVIGAASQFTASNTKKRSVTGLRFVDPAPLVSARIKELRAQNLDAVIVTIHDGARCTVGLSEGCEGSGIEFVRKLTEKPDAVLLAHAHTNMVLNINEIPSVQVSSNGRGIGIIDIPLNPRATGKVSVRDVIGDSTRVVDPVLDTIIKNAVGRVRTRLEQPVTTVKETLTRRGEQYPLGNLIADAMRVMGSADFGAWNNGGIRADLRAGPLNFGGVHEITPFGNVIAKLSVRGKDMRAMIENIVRGRAPDAHVSGLQVVYDAAKPVGQRVTSLTLANGSPIDPNKVYTIAVNDYMIDDPEFANPSLIVSTQILPISDSAAISEYFKRLPQPLTAPTEVRIRTTGESR